MQTEEQIRQRIVNLRVIGGTEQYNLQLIDPETDHNRYIAQVEEIAVINGKIEELLRVLGEIE